MMGERRVRGPDGRSWVVRRRWSSRAGGPTLGDRARQRARRSTRGATKAGDVSLVSALLFDDGAVVVRWLVIAVVAVVLLVLTSLLLVVELAILALLVLVGVGGRVLFRQPWTVEAVSDAGDRLTWPVVGWRASAARRDEVTGQLRAGVTPRPTAGTSGGDTTPPAGAPAPPAEEPGAT